MMNASRRSLLVFISLLMVGAFPAAFAANRDFEGEWLIDREESTAIDPWSRILLDISVDEEAVTIIRTVTTGRRSHTQDYPLVPGQTVDIPIEWWTGNRHIGAYMGGDDTMAIKTEWLDGGRTLRTESEYVLETSQGETPARTYREYRLSPDGTELRVMTLRSSRDRPILHIFNRQ